MYPEEFWTSVAVVSAVLAEGERLQSIAPEVIAAIRLLILTGCRRNEILALRWEYVDFEGRCLRLPDSKTGPKTVPLNSAALELLSNIERQEENPHVIPGRKAGTHLFSLGSQWPRIRAAAGLEDVRLHDLRHNADSRIMPSKGPEYRESAEILASGRRATRHNPAGCSAPRLDLRGLRRQGCFLS